MDRKSTVFFLSLLFRLKTSDGGLKVYEISWMVHQNIKSLTLSSVSIKVIRRGSGQDWPPRSPNLTPSDLLLSGNLKQNIYKRRLFTNIVHYENTFVDCGTYINPQFIRNVVKNGNRKTIVFLNIFKLFCLEYVHILFFYSI